MTQYQQLRGRYNGRLEARCFRECELLMTSVGSWVIDSPPRKGLQLEGHHMSRESVG